MFKRGQCNRLKNIEVLKDVVDKLIGIFDARDLYHHSSVDGEICKLAYFYDGNREGFYISFMGDVICEEPLSDYYEDETINGVVDFDDFDAIYERCYDAIITDYNWRLGILNWSEVSQEEKNDIKSTLTSGK